MNSLWPAVSRFSYTQCRPSLKAYSKIDSLSARLVQSAARPYTVASVGSRGKGLAECNPRFGREYMRRAFTASWFNSTRSYVSKSKKGKYEIPGGNKVEKIEKIEKIEEIEEIEEKDQQDLDGIVRDFEKLPLGHNYQDGLPYTKEPLTSQQFEEIFGKVVDETEADELLRVVHYERVSGMLDESDLLQDDYYHAALAWLREHVPVNEQENIAKKYELQLAQLEDLEKGTGKRAWVPNEGGKADSIVFKEGALERIRKKNEARFEREQQKKLEREAEEAKNFKTGIVGEVKPSPWLEPRREGVHPKLIYYQERAQSFLPATPPEYTAFQRLYPSGAFAFFFTVLTLGAVYFYTPPKRADRWWPDIPPAVATIIPIVLAYTTIYALWHFSPAWLMLNKYFVSVPAYPFAVSLLGHTFSHQSFWHFAANLAMTVMFGVPLHDDIGRANFLAVFMLGGVWAGFASLAHKQWVGNFRTSSVGASGAVAAIMMCYFLLHWDEGFKVPLLPDGLVPFGIPSLVFVVMILIPEIFWVVKRGGIASGIDNASHLGGYITGAVCAPVIGYRMKQAKERRRLEEEERRKNMRVIQKVGEALK